MYNKLMEIILRSLRWWNQTILPYLSLSLGLLGFLFLVRLFLIHRSLQKRVEESLPKIKKDIQVIQKIHDDIQTDLQQKKERFSLLIRSLSVYFFLQMFRKNKNCEKPSLFTSLYHLGRIYRK